MGRRAPDDSGSIGPITLPRPGLVAILGAHDARLGSTGSLEDADPACRPAGHNDLVRGHEPALGATRWSRAMERNP